MVNFRVLFVLVAAGLFSANAASIAHDKVQPIAQPKPVTIASLSPNSPLAADAPRSPP